MNRSNFVNIIVVTVLLLAFSSNFAFAIESNIVVDFKVEGNRLIDEKVILLNVSLKSGDRDNLIH